MSINLIYPNPNVTILPFETLKIERVRFTDNLKKK